MASNDPYAQAWETSEALNAQQPEGSNLSGTGADPTHHIVLTDGIADVGFVLTDQQGDLDERTFRRFPRTEPVQPYVTEKQDSWGSGFGQATFEDNRTKYWRGNGIDTMKDVLVLGPAFHYAKGSFSKAQDNISYSTMTWYQLAGTVNNPAGSFTTSQEWTSTKYLKFFMKPLRDRGVLPTLRVKIWTDEGNDEPTTLIETFTFVASTFDDVVGGEWVRVNITDTYTYTADTKYWVSFDDLGDGSGVYILGFNNTSANGVKYSGGSWGAWYPPIFRIESVNAPFNARFFDYKQQLYTVLDFDNSTSSQMFRNGWRGAPTTGGSSLQLKDSTQTDWATKITGDEVVHIMAGPTSGELEDRKTVASGISGTLTLNEAWNVTLSTRDEYVVTNSDYWSKITTASVVNSISGKVTDVAVADGVVYLCRSNLRNVALFREFNNAGTWTVEGSTSSGAKGQFVQMISDPISGDTLWFGFNPNISGEYRPLVWQSEPAEFDSGGLDFLSVGQSAGDSGVTQHWVASGSDTTVVGSAYSATFQVTIGKVESAEVGTTGGSGYAVNDTIKVQQQGSSKTCVLKVTAVSGGEVTAVDEVVTEGWDYRQGSDISTTVVTGSGDGACVVNLTGVSGVSGTLGYIDLYDADDAAATYDIRNMTNFNVAIVYETVGKEPNSTSVGDFKLLFDDTQGCSTPFYTADVVGLQAGIKDASASKTVSIAIADTDYGASQLTSIGVSIADGFDKTFKLTLKWEMVFYRSPAPAVVSRIDGDNITGFETFGDPETLWVFTEAGFGQMKNNKFLPVPQREVQTARHKNNGSGHGVSDVYLLFTWRGRLQRYFRQNMEDLGPDFPAGMGDIAGDVVDVVSYPGRVYVAIDAGVSGKSMILCYKGGGWHEVWTGFTGERIRNLYIQSIEGKSDKLWASIGGDLMWFPIALDSAELPDNTDYRYRPMGYIDSSWVYTGSRELDKLFRSILLTVDDASNTSHKWDVFFKIDDPNGDWIKVTGSEEPRSTAMLEYFFAGAQGNLPKGNRIRVRLYLETRDTSSSPTIRSTQMRIYRVPEVKYAYNWLTKLSSISINLRGDEEKVIGTKANVEKAFNQLDLWSSGLTPLFVKSTIASIADKQVVLSPIPSQLLLLVPDDTIQEQTIQVQVNDI